MKNCIITGGNSGIGFQAAMQIAEKGYNVTMICRNETAAKNTCKEITLNTGNKNVDYLIADLSEMNAVSSVAKKYLDIHDSLDVLINNAADFDLSIKTPIMTSDGMEKQFATNVAAPFLLSRLLFDALSKS
ncbi:MAG: SDR family NAD(P)-dependent oxidoreductase, partial [Oscillospiraceae bacterium]|nr:SDR family NAD(P)-dependent oxidoreductase [Oscillospiraceae bacterium]